MSTLELIWQHDAPYAVVRSDDGVLTDDGLAIGSRTEIHVAGSHAVARRLSVADLTDLDTELPLGPTARAVLALRDLARRTVADGLVHPQLTRGGTPGTRSGARRSTRACRQSSTRSSPQRRPPPASSTSSTRSSSTRSRATACSLRRFG